MKGKLRVLVAFVTVIAVFFSMSTFAFAAESSITAPLKNKGNEDKLHVSYSYDQNTRLNEDEVGLVVPIKVKKAGTIQLDYSIDKLEEFMSCKMFTDKECTNSISTNVFNVGDTEDTSFIDVSSSGTYFLKLSSNYSEFLANYNPKTFENSVDIRICEWHNGDQTIKSGQTITNYNGRTDHRDYKFKATKNGKITVTHDSKYGFDVQILNAKKKALSEKQWCASNLNPARESCQFAVEKGKTYIIRVYPNDSGTTYHHFKLVQKEVKEKSGATRKKAVQIKAKKKVKGTIAAGSKKADWYKLKLTKKKSLTIYLKGEASSYLNVTVYNSKGKKIGTQYMTRNNDLEAKVTNSTTIGKANKGTYYIKISRKSSKDSGVYQLSWR